MKDSNTGSSRLCHIGFRVLTTAVAVITACSATMTVFGLEKNDSDDSSSGKKYVASKNEISYFKSEKENEKFIFFKKNDTVPDLPGWNYFEKIKIPIVSYKTRVESVKIDFNTEIIYNDNLDKGTERIIKSGSKGEKIVISTEKYVDGKLTETVIYKEKIKIKPVTEIKEIGTKELLPDLSDYSFTSSPISEIKLPSYVKLDKKGLPVKYKSVIYGKATAYSGDTETSTGAVPMPGIVAVDPKEIPYGSELYIVSADGAYVYGYGIAADTGGFVKMGNTDIDLFMNTEEMCNEWGNRKVVIYILN